jgi:hypothetical protein
LGCLKTDHAVRKVVGVVSLWIFVRHRYSGAADNIAMAKGSFNMLIKKYSFCSNSGEQENSFKFFFSENLVSGEQTLDFEGFKRELL